MISLNEYLNDPASAFKCLDKVTAPFEYEKGESLIKMAVDLALSDDRRIFYRKGQVKKILGLMFPEKKIKFLIPKKMEVTAFMDDRGALSLSLGCFFKLSSCGFLIVLIHEISHLMMAVLPEYDKLKMLNKEFLQKYAEEQNCVQISPIEIIACQVSAYIFNEKILPSITSEKKRNELIRKLKEECQNYDNYINRIKKLQM